MTGNRRFVIGAYELLKTATHGLPSALSMAATTWWLTDGKDIALSLASSAVMWLVHLGVEWGSDNRAKRS